MMTSSANDGILGILMLDTQFPRILGDAGNPDTYPFKTLIEVVENAGSLDVVNGEPLSHHLCQNFINAAQKLERDGVRAIISTCGFLITEQQKIAQAVNIPVMVSALSLSSQIKREIGKKRIVILTASACSLGQFNWETVGVHRSDVDIIGMETCAAFSNAILQKKEDQSQKLDTKEIEEFIVEKLTQLLKNDAANGLSIGAILLECGNLPPYIPAILSTTDLPIFSILDAANVVMANDNRVI